MICDLTLESTRGQPVPLQELGRVRVLFYEAYGHTQDNESLKQACARLLTADGLGGRLEVLGVADLAGLGFGLVRHVVRRAVQAAAARYGTELLLDFQGALQRPPFSLTGGDSNVAVVAADGSIVFRAHGPLDEATTERFFDALTSALARLGVACPSAA